MLARALFLESRKPVVTPGVKLPFDDAAPTGDDTCDVPEHNVVSPAMRRKRIVKYNDSADVVYVPDQATTYGRHPRTLDLSADGRMMRRRHTADQALATTAQANSMHSKPNARRAIIRSALRDGAAWEIHTVELFAKVSTVS